MGLIVKIVFLLLIIGFLNSLISKASGTTASGTSASGNCDETIDSNWSPCEGGVQTKQQIINVPANGGTPCTPVDELTRNCKYHCDWGDYGAYGACEFNKTELQPDLTCGERTKSRTRQAVKHVMNGDDCVVSMTFPDGVTNPNRYDEQTETVSCDITPCELRASCNWTGGPICGDPSKFECSPRRSAMSTCKRVNGTAVVGETCVDTDECAVPYVCNNASGLCEQPLAECNQGSFMEGWRSCSKSCGFGDGTQYKRYNRWDQPSQEEHCVSFLDPGFYIDETLGNGIARACKPSELCRRGAPCNVDEDCATAGDKCRYTDYTYDLSTGMNKICMEVVADGSLSEGDRCWTQDQCPTTMLCHRAVPGWTTIEERYPTCKIGTGLHEQQMDMTCGNPGCVAPFRCSGDLGYPDNPASMCYYPAGSRNVGETCHGYADQITNTHPRGSSECATGLSCKARRNAQRIYQDHRCAT